MDINDRISHLMEKKNLTKKEFADKIDVNRTNINHILDGRNKPGYDFLHKTLKAFSDINAEWLMTGNGDMYNASHSDHSPTLFEYQEHETPQKEHVDTDKKQEPEKTEEKKQEKTVNRGENSNSELDNILENISKNENIVVFSKETFINGRNVKPEDSVAASENIEPDKSEHIENEIESIIVCYRDRTCKRYKFV
ncbi:MAG: helix-turn-helix domain-containing protein [Prevotellaceae bacterium]|jgi:transcriptional regulator with XRE-family HTH domain|nr:helix-turn-helix domain-containing protein [Prevotellaceae bacterium]